VFDPHLSRRAATDIGIRPARAGSEMWAAIFSQTPGVLRVRTEREAQFYEFSGGIVGVLAGNASTEFWPDVKKKVLRH
jgi:hypothetical protein